MVELDVKIQLGQIGINLTHPETNMNIQEPDMILQEEKPAFLLEISHPRIKDIDQRACFREIGLMNFMDGIRQTAEEGQANALAVIERRAQQGDRLARIHDKSVTIAKVASEIPNHTKEINIDIAPKSRPRITFQEGDVNVDLRYGRVKTSLKPGDLGYVFNYGTVDVYLEKKPEVDIEAKGMVYDLNV